MSQTFAVLNTLCSVLICISDVFVYNISGFFVSRNQSMRLCWKFRENQFVLKDINNVKIMLKIGVVSFLFFCPNIGFGQSVPCEFSWANVPTSNGRKNFVTAVKEQPYQGPCLSFAYVAAIEAKYAIENNIVNPTLQVSDAYFDYKMWGGPTVKSALESGFKIPVVGGVNTGLNNFPPGCKKEDKCSLVNQVKECIDDVSGQRNYYIDTTLIETIDKYGGEKIDTLYSVLCKNKVNDFVTVNNVNKITSLSSVDDLKRKILNSGPVVIRVNGLENVKKFRDYISIPSVFSYHAFVIIGWTNDSKWIIKDSWPTNYGIAQTKPNIDIVGLLNSGSIELTQVAGISRNGGAVSSSSIALSMVDCSLVPVLSNIQSELEYATIDGYMYHKFWVTSDKSVDKWVWGIDYPNGSVKRSQVDTPNHSSILLSPTTSGNVTVFVNGFKNGVKVTKEIRLYLTNGQPSVSGAGL